MSVLLLASLIRAITRVWPLHKAIGSCAVLDTRSLLVKNALFLHSILQVVEFLHVFSYSQPLLGDIYVLQDEFLDHFPIRYHDIRLPRSRWVCITCSLVLLISFKVLVSPCRGSESSLGKSFTKLIWDCVILLWGLNPLSCSWYFLAPHQLLK